MLLSLEGLAYSVCTSRIILNIREAACNDSSGIGMELHTDYDDSVSEIVICAPIDPDEICDGESMWGRGVVICDYIVMKLNLSYVDEGQVRIDTNSRCSYPRWLGKK